MTFAASGGLLVLHLAVAGACLVALLVPGWWLAGRILDRDANPFWRLLWAAGLALIGYLTFVNLVGRLVGNSTWVATVYFAINVAVGARLWRRRPAEVNWTPLAYTWRSWMGPVLLALVLGLPQWFVAVSANYYDEAASSAIHLTAANQFAEGVFPPRHNALPDVVIKYHYGFTILSGTVHWLTGLTANASIDVVSTLLWLFVFLFIVFWFSELGLSRFASTFAGFAALLGGGLQWAYLTKIEAYSSVWKTPDASMLLHKWNPESSWISNLVAAAEAPGMHLRNGDGSLSSLSWDVAAQFQQHAVALGLALTVIALALFVRWQHDAKGVRFGWMAANVVAFGLLPLGHAAFGAMAAVAAGLWLLGTWLRRPTRDGFLRGVCFGVGVGGLTLLHGGLFARGPQYGSDAVASLRHTFGYSAGGFAGFVHWNLASLGVPLLLAIVAWVLHRRYRSAFSPDTNRLFGVLTVLACVSWLIPQVMYYSSDSIGAEQFTEISKFFFIARFALALLSGFGIAYVIRSVHWSALLPAFPAMALIPLAYVYQGAVGVFHGWQGFYRTPYYENSIEQQMGETLRAMKHSPRDVYFDVSADERNSNFLGELLIYGSSVFTLTPSRYERTGVGYRLAESVVAKRLVLNGRMARLAPGSAEECGCTWYYTRPVADMTLAPVLVRSRFEKLVAEGYMEPVFVAAPRELYVIRRPTADLDSGIDRYWRPRVVAQPTRSGAAAVEFFDRANNRIVAGDATRALPDVMRGESVQLYVGRFPGDRNVTLRAGRMLDTDFGFGKTIEQLYEWSPWGWTVHADSGRGAGAEYRFADWAAELPLVANIGIDGADSHLVFRPRSGTWVLALSGVAVAGPAATRADLPLPFGGHFLQGSRGDLGVWNVATGTVVLRSVGTDRSVSFAWGGRPGDVLVPGDYDGDGRDEIAVWQRTNQTWYWRHAPDGPISQAVFGTATGIPLPADYDGDGQLDLAYWEPSAGKIFVSYSRGRSVGRVIAVPRGTIPAFVNFY